MQSIPKEQVYYTMSLLLWNTNYVLHKAVFTAPLSIYAYRNPVD